MRVIVQAPLAGKHRDGHIIGNSYSNQEAKPMSTFDDREHAFENKFAHDAEMQFKADARRNKMLGLWAADLMGKTGTDADDYAKEVVKSDFEEAGHEDVYRKVSGDLGDKADEATIRAKMAELMTKAKAQLMDEI
ncbi:hypothetical protein RCCS2_18026 [Roseobacter sp. CCS2]|nr:hypothetical protein RCCS2_18026 [Roseobacter sp. CCS2]